MIRTRLTLLMLLLFNSWIVSAEIWSIGTAEILKPKTVEIGIFTPLRYGLDETTEISTYPVFNLLLPNASVKKQWYAQGKNYFATEHTISYPTLFLKTISREGTGGVLPNNTNIPQLLTVNNHFYFTHKVTPYIWLTPQFNIEHTFNAKQNVMPTIDFPLAYQRTASYHTGTIFRAGFDVDGELLADWSYTIDIDYYYLPDMDGNEAWEHKTLLRYHFSKSFSALAGYKYISAEYPFGKDSRFFPLLDLSWTW